MKIQKLVLFAVFAALALAALSQSAFAAPESTDYYVNTTTDKPDLKLDGVCEVTLNQGDCSLRAAVMESNYHVGAENIHLQAGATYFLSKGVPDDTAQSGDLDLNGQVTIQGNGAIVDGNYFDRVFDIHSGALATFLGMTIRHGQTTGGGAGVQIAGGIGEFYGVKFINDIANTGGAIYTGSGTAIVFNSSFDVNDAQGAFGGGAIFNAGLLEVANSTFTDNQAISGGAIYNGKNAMIENSTFSGNKATDSGGAIYTGDTANAQTRLFNVTIANNKADSDNKNGGAAGGIFNNPFSTTTMRNSILAGNADMTNTTPDNKADDCYAVITSEGYNLVGNKHLCGGFINGQNGDKVGDLGAVLDPKLGAVADNGGGLETLALLAGSPAIDAGDPNGCLNSNDQRLYADERGYNRPVNGGAGRPPRCDMGAFEYNSTLVNCSLKPLEVNPYAPANGSQTNLKKVTLIWTSSFCAKKYQVTVRQDSKQGTPFDSYAGPATSHLTKALPKGHTYFWQVQACNKAGCTKSVWRKFKVQ